MCNTNHKSLSQINIVIIGLLLFTPLCFLSCINCFYEFGCKNVIQARNLQCVGGTGVMCLLCIYVSMVRCKDTKVIWNVILQELFLILACLISNSLFRLLKRYPSVQGSYALQCLT